MRGGDLPVCGIDSIISGFQVRALLGIRILRRTGEIISSEPVRRLRIGWPWSHDAHL